MTSKIPEGMGPSSDFPVQPPQHKATSKQESLAKQAGDISNSAAQAKITPEALNDARLAVEFIKGHTVRAATIRELDPFPRNLHVDNVMIAQDGSNKLLIKGHILKQLEDPEKFEREISSDEVKKLAGFERRYEKAMNEYVQRPPTQPKKEVPQAPGPSKTVQRVEEGSTGKSQEIQKAGAIANKNDVTDAEILLAEKFIKNHGDVSMVMREKDPFPRNFKPEEFFPAMDNSNRYVVKGYVREPDTDQKPYAEFFSSKDIKRFAGLQKRYEQEMSDYAQKPPIKPKTEVPQKVEKGLPGKTQEVEKAGAKKMMKSATDEDFMLADKFIRKHEHAFKVLKIKDPFPENFQPEQIAKARDGTNRLLVGGYIRKPDKLTVDENNRIIVEQHYKPEYYQKILSNVEIGALAVLERRYDKYIKTLQQEALKFIKDTPQYELQRLILLDKEVYKNLATGKSYELDLRYIDDDFRKQMKALCDKNWGITK